MSNTDKYDPDGIDKAAQACEAKGCMIVYGGIVKKINETNGGESKRILIVSNTFITFVKTVITSLSHTYYWSDLSSVRFLDKDGMELIFKKVRKNSSKTNQFRFRSRERPVILRKIIDVLYHTLTPMEISKIDLDFPHPEISINPRGVFSRFDEHLIKGNIAITDSKLRDQIKKDCQITNPICIPKAIVSQKEIKALFYALIGSPFTRAVFFPEIKDLEIVEKMYKYMGLFVNSPTNLQFFSFRNPVTPRFDEFSKALIDKSETSISGIGFREVTMPEEGVEKVKKIVGEANLMSLRWCSISPVNSSESLLKDRKVKKSLRYLALDGSKGINFRKIAPRLSHIAVLSLENSDLEIADVFKVINKAKLTELKMLNLGHNNASKPIESSSLISSKLQRIDISHARFSNNVMKNILEVILTADYENGLKFYCDQYHASDNEVDDALSNFQNISTNSLLEFSWRRNKIDKNLLNFLKNNRNLEKLILKGNVYNSNDEKIVKEFSSICPSLKNLTHLYVCGSKKGELGASFQNQLIDGLKKLPKLTYLDVSNNSISDEGIQSITTSLKEFSSLTHIILDNNKITSITPLKKLGEKAIQLYKNLYISWPINDIKTLLQENTITDSDVTDLISLFNTASTASNSSTINHSSIPLDDGVLINSKNKPTINSSSVKNKAAVSGKQRKQRTGSVFIRTGSVRNLKRALAESDDRVQDPDSIFIQPFETWFGNIDDTNFPLFLSEDLANELDVKKYDPENDFDDVESDTDIEIESDSEDELPVKSRSINSPSKRSNQSFSNNSDSDDDREEKENKTIADDSDDINKEIKKRKTITNDSVDINKGKVIKTRKTITNDSYDANKGKEIKTRKTIANDSNNTRLEKENKKRNIIINSDSEDDNDQQIKKYVKPPPPLKPANRVLSSSSNNQKAPSSSNTKKNSTLKNKYIDDEEEPNKIKERNISIENKDEKESVLHRQINKEKISDIDSDDFAKSSPKNTSSQRYTTKTKHSPPLFFSQSQPRSPKSVTKRIAPSLDLNDSELADVAYDDQINEAAQFEAPSWSFPVPRISRVSNSEFISELNNKYSVASVINNLRSKK